MTKISETEREKIFKYDIKSNFFFPISMILNGLLILILVFTIYDKNKEVDGIKVHKNEIIEEKTIIINLLREKLEKQIIKNDLF